MTDKQIIEGLQDLIIDRESFITEEDSIFTQDKKVLEEAINLIQKRQEELEEKDKIIDKIAEALVRIPENTDDPQTLFIIQHINSHLEEQKKEIIKYFKKKAEEK